jgi:hypothetical protein
LSVASEPSNTVPRSIALARHALDAGVLLLPVALLVLLIASAKQAPSLDAAVAYVREQLRAEDLVLVDGVPAQDAVRAFAGMPVVTEGFGRPRITRPFERVWLVDATKTPVSFGYRGLPAAVSERRAGGIRVTLHAFPAPTPRPSPSPGPAPKPAPPSRAKMPASAKMPANPAAPAPPPVTNRP